MDLTYLNSNQQAAVEAGKGAWQVLAGPGSGKTSVLVQRYIRLVHDEGARPLCLTFTRKAAEEMSGRARAGNFRTIGSQAFLVQYRTEVECELTPDVFDLKTLVRKATERLREEHRQHPGGYYRYDYVMVDEAQDCSQEDWDFIKLLSPNIFCVGDFSQCLYGFRGSKPDLFLHMEENFPEVKTIFLGQNYRSSKSIVRFCKKIAPIRGEFLEHLCTDNEEGDPVQFLNYSNNVDEAEDILRRASQLPGSTAVLARTNHQLNIYRALGTPLALCLSTIHAAKGKEWDSVFVVGVQEGLLPFKNGDEDEESRILFVACSRARKRLFLSGYGTPTRFITNAS